MSNVDEMEWFWIFEAREEKWTSKRFYHLSLSLSSVKLPALIQWEMRSLKNSPLALKCASNKLNFIAPVIYFWILILSCRVERLFSEEIQSSSIIMRFWFNHPIRNLSILLSLIVSYSTETFENMEWRAAYNNENENCNPIWMALPYLWIESLFHAKKFTCCQHVFFNHWIQDVR